MHTYKLAFSRFLWRQKYTSSFHVHQDKLDTTLRTIASYAPRIIIGYTTPLYMLARVALEHAFELPSHRSIITSAERFFPEQRHVIEQAFRAPVFDRYGCREVMLIGGEYERHTGLHVNAEEVFVELIRGDRHAPPGTTGEVILSDLRHRSMPLLRYRNDNVSAAKLEVCLGGRGLPLLSFVEGRVLDLIVGTNGRIIAGAAFMHLLEDYPSNVFKCIDMRIVCSFDRTPPVDATSFGRAHEAWAQSSGRWSSRDGQPSGRYVLTSWRRNTSSLARWWDNQQLSPRRWKLWRGVRIVAPWESAVVKTS